MNKPRILNIVPTFRDPAYIKMAHSLREFYKKFENVRTIFVEYRDDIDEEIIFQDDFLFLKGKDAISPPGPILRKTIDTILFFENELLNYQYVIRSNVSTVLDFYLINEILSRSRQILHYFTPLVNTLCMLEPKLGIVDKRYFGVKYASGTFIGMSIDLVSILLHKRHYLDYSVVDDVAIGVFVRDHTPFKEIWHTPKEKFFWNDEDVFDIGIAKIKYACDFLLPLAYRNKSTNRLVDCDFMDFIINSINQRVDSDLSLVNLR